MASSKLNMLVFLSACFILANRVQGEWEQYICADVCKCSRDVPPKGGNLKTLRVNCKGLDLAGIPVTKLLYDAWHANSIDLSNNLITRVPDNAFRGQTQLVNLALDHNDIEFIHASAFNVSTNQGDEGGSPLQYINLRVNHLHNIPECFGRRANPRGRLVNLQYLLLGGNPLGAALDKDSFYGVPKLETLDLSHCMIKEVPVGVLEPLKDLNNLDLSYNKLTILHYTIFASDPPLKKLNLNGNQFSGVPEHLPTELVYLQLSENQIRNLTAEDARTLGSLRMLTVLDLSKNNLRLYLYKSFSALTSLQMLDLSENSIEFLSINTFKGLLHLNYLFLNNNPFLTTIAPETFTSLPNLSHLFLQSCALSKLTLTKEQVNSKMPLLKFIWLFDNPINCNCELVPLVRYLKRNQVRFDLSYGEIMYGSNNTTIFEAISAKVKRLDLNVRPTLCVAPQNRHRTVVGRTITSVPESYLTCPDEPLYVVVSVFLGIILFAAAIPLVFCLIAIYLLLVRFAKKHLGWKFDDGEE